MTEPHSESSVPEAQEVQKGAEYKIDLLLAKFEAFSQQQHQLLHNLVQRLSAQAAVEAAQPAQPTQPAQPSQPKKRKSQLLPPEKSTSPGVRSQPSVDFTPPEKSASVPPAAGRHESISSDGQIEEGTPTLAQVTKADRLSNATSSYKVASKSKSCQSLISQNSASVLAVAWHDEIRTRSANGNRSAGGSRRASMDRDSSLRTLSANSILSVREMNSAFVHAVAQNWKPNMPPWQSISRSPGASENGESDAAASSSQAKPAPAPATVEPEAEVSPDIGGDLPGLLEVTPISSAVDRVTPLRPSAGSTAMGERVTMMSLTHISQAVIIDKFNTTTPVEAPPMEQDVGCRLALNFPRFLYGVLVFFAFAQSGVMVAMKALGYVESVGYSFAIMASILYSLNAVLCIYLLRRALTSEDLAAAMSKLHMFVAQSTKHWNRLSTREAQRLALVWALLITSFALCHALEEWKVEAGFIPMPKGTEDIKILRHVIAVMSVVSFCISSAVVVIVAYVQSHFLLGMDKSLDCWCCSLLEAGDFHVGVESWNCLQAMLKSIGRELASSFLAAQLLGAVGFVYFLTSCVTFAFQSGFAVDQIFMEALSALPLLFLFGLGLRVFSYGAALTEKCRVIPAFVNQIPSEIAIDQERQYLVRFITDSSAGFFVGDVRLTREMFLKNFIIVGGVLSGLVGVLSRIPI